jgi:hypothetical protein
VEKEKLDYTLVRGPVGGGICSLGARMTVRIRVKAQKGK